MKAPRREKHKERSGIAWSSQNIEKLLFQTASETIKYFFAATLLIISLQTTIDDNFDKRQCLVPALPASSHRLAYFCAFL